MTQKEIANILNISRATVSLALADSPKIKPETRKRVREIAKKSNYQPNMAARSLVMQRTNSVGVLLPSFAHRFLGELSDEIFRSLNQNGFTAIFGIGSEIEDQSKLIDSMVSRNVDGIISYFTDYHKLIKLNENGVPLVVYRKPQNYPLSYVDVDRFKGGRLVTEHLIEIGCRKIAFVGGVVSDGKWQDKRFAGFQSAMTENDIDIDESLIINLMGEMREGIVGVGELLKRTNGVLPDAIIFHNDSMAIGALGEIDRLGFKVPEDVAVVGFDNIEESKYSSPSLTTINQPKELMAQKLVSMLIEQINNKDTGFIAKNHIFEPELIIRKSTSKQIK